MATQRLSVTILLLASTACGTQSPDAQPSIPYLQVLEQGLTHQFDVKLFPHGRVQIMDATASYFESADTKHLRFQSNYLEFLKKARTDGLLVLKEDQETEMQRMAHMGVSFFAVSPTEKLSKMQDATSSNQQFIGVPLGTIKVLGIMKDEEYKAPAHIAGPGDQFRLILGTARDIPSSQAITLGKYYGTIEPQTLKFRAVLQFNPFAKTYTYVAAALGNPQDAAWKTEHVK